MVSCNSSLETILSNQKTTNNIVETHATFALPNKHLSVQSSMFSLLLSTASSETCGRFHGTYELAQVDREIGLKG